MSTQTLHETHPFLVSVWVFPPKLGQAFFERLYLMEMARCRSDYRANEVAEGLAIRHRLVQVSRLQGDRFIPIRHLPDEETMKRETEHQR